MKTLKNPKRKRKKNENSRDRERRRGTWWLIWWVHIARHSPHADSSIIALLMFCNRGRRQTCGPYPIYIEKTKKHTNNRTQNVN